MIGLQEELRGPLDNEPAGRSPLTWDRLIPGDWVTLPSFNYYRSSARGSQFRSAVELSTALSPALSRRGRFRNNNKERTPTPTLGIGGYSKACFFSLSVPPASQNRIAPKSTFHWLHPAKKNQRLGVRHHQCLIQCMHKYYEDLPECYPVSRCRQTYILSCFLPPQD